MKKFATVKLYLKCSKKPTVVKMPEEDVDEFRSQFLQLMKQGSHIVNIGDLIFAIDQFEKIEFFSKK